MSKTLTVNATAESPAVATIPMSAPTVDVLKLSVDELTERIVDAEAELKILRRVLKLATEYEALKASTVAK